MCVHFVIAPAYVCPLSYCAGLNWDVLLVIPVWFGNCCYHQIYSLPSSLITVSKLMCDYGGLMSYKKRVVQRNIFEYTSSLTMIICTQQVNEEASDEVLKVEQKYNEIRKPVYDRRNEIIQTIPDFWLTAVSGRPYIQ